MTTKGLHIMELNLLDFKLTIYNDTNTDVGEYTFHNGNAEGNRQLLAGGHYSISLSLRALARAVTVQVSRYRKQVSFGCERFGC